MVVMGYVGLGCFLFEVFALDRKTCINALIGMASKIIFV